MTSTSSRHWTPPSPLPLPLGREAVERIRTKLTKQFQELNTWDAFGRNTRINYARS